MACASALTELIKGKTPEEVRKVRLEQVLEEVGGVPEASGHAAQLAIDAVRALLKSLGSLPG
jgi:NifU-like protein involved in Fe-S cluster formation